LEYICQQLGHLKVVKSVPEDIGEDVCTSLANRSADVRSACMLYLAAQIKHDKVWLGMIGNIFPLRAHLTGNVGKVIKTFFAGDGEFEDADACLQKSVNNYRQAVETTGLVVGFDILKIVKGITSIPVSD
jgi:hypothetical protein